MIMGMYVTYMQVALNRLSRLHLGTNIHIYRLQKEKKRLGIWKGRRSRRISAGKKEKAKNGVNAVYSLKYFLNILKIEVTHSPCLCAPYYLGGKKKNMTPWFLFLWYLWENAMGSTNVCEQLCTYSFKEL